MTLSEVLKTGAHKIIRKSWEYPDEPVIVRVDSRFVIEEILADDWEVYKEPRKVTLYQYLYEYSCKKMLMSLETNETWDQYNCDRDDCKLLKTFTREIEL